MAAVDLYAEQDVISDLVAAHRIYTGNDTAQDKVTIERLELYLEPSGLRLMPGRVHALSAVRRRRPIYLLPPRPPLAINRHAELETLRLSITTRKVVDLHGPDGAGKSTLAAALIHDLDLNHFPDGVVYVTGRIHHEDLLQSLFDSFYESDSPVKITLRQSYTYLHSLRALVILDDVGLGPKQVDPILDALNDGTVLIVGSERTALGRGEAVPLKGLPHQEAVTLFGIGLARTPSSDESLIIDQICTLLNDMPLPISCIAAQAGQSKRSLAKLLVELQERKPWAGAGGDPSVGPSLEQIVLALDATDRQLLTLIAAFSSPTASSEALRRLMNLSPDAFQERCERLRALGLLHAVRPFRSISAPASRGKSTLRVALTSAYYQTVRTWLVDDAVRRGVVNYYATRLGRGDRLPGDELPALLGAIEDCARQGWLDHLKPLVQAADRSLAQLCWWAQWQHVLDLTRRAAQAEGDRALEAWATHQLGSVLGSLGHFERAFQLLRSALSMRQALGDQAGAKLSAHNLDVLDRLQPVPARDQTLPATASAASPQRAAQPAPVPAEENAVEPSPAEAVRRKRFSLRLALLVALASLVIGALALRFVAGVGEPEDTVPGLTVSWEFGEAWNALDNETWTQQIIIVAPTGDDDYRYFVNDEPSGEMFQVNLPLCSGAEGTIRVESGDGKQAEIEYAFDSPYCR
jgi:hypothetical protein